MNHRPSPRTTPPARRWVAAVVVVAVLGLLASCGDESATGGEPASTGPGQLQPCPSVQSRQPAVNGLPEVSLPCLGEGPDIRLSDLRGPLVINVWAQWCTPCRDEAPFFAELQRKAGDKVQLLGIDYVDTRPDLAVKFAVEHHWDYPQLADRDKRLQQPLKIGGPPLTVFVDKSGAVVHVQRKPITSQHELDQLVKDKLGVGL